MARLSDIIEEFIKEMMKDTEKKELEIQRNELANYFSCAPSQINYVLTTRFTTEKGYYIESQRGGGGCIRIKKVDYDKDKSLSEIINDRIGNNITYSIGARIIDSLYESDVITERELRIMKVAINDRTLSMSYENKNKVRAQILKSMILLIM